MKRSNSRPDTTRRRRCALGLALVLGAFVVSCDDDTSTSWRTDFSSDNNGQTTNTQGGLVIIWVHDAPLADVAAFRVTVGEVALLDAASGAPETVVYRSATGRRIDLAALRRQGAGLPHEILAVARDAPAETWSGLRVVFVDPEAVLADGSILRGDALRLAGGGRVEARGLPDLRLEPGGRLDVRLDVELDLSLSAAEPVGAAATFLPILTVEPVADAPREVFGAASEIDGVIAARPSAAGFRLDLDGGRGSLDVALDPDALVLDESGLPRSARTLRAGERVLARGALGARDRFDARWIIAGETASLYGIVATAPQALAGGGVLFAFRPLDGRGGAPDGAALAIALDPMTPVTLARLHEVPLDVIAHGARARIRVPAAALEMGLAGATVRAALVDVDREAIEGEVIDVATGRRGQGGSVVVDAGSVPRFLIDPATRLQRGEGDPIDAAALLPGDRVRVHAAPGRADLAESIETLSERLDGSIDAFDAATHGIIVRVPAAGDGAMARLRPDADASIRLAVESATGLTIRPASLDALAPGMRVTARLGTSAAHERGILPARAIIGIAGEPATDAATR